ncbi:MAG: hypothetical protein Rpha_1131 [Candidatus Ruthia sp. Apha_13_S6]|nr:hypothetical protein [Candidatus Ruthia sp. Apha_13_S6]
MLLTVTLFEPATLGHDGQQLCPVQLSSSLPTAAVISRSLPHAVR